MSLPLVFWTGCLSICLGPRDSGSSWVWGTLLCISSSVLPLPQLDRAAETSPSAARTAAPAAPAAPGLAAADPSECPLPGQPLPALPKAIREGLQAGGFEPVGLLGGGCWEALAHIAVRDWRGAGAVTELAVFRGIPGSQGGVCAGDVLSTGILHLSYVACSFFFGGKWFQLFKMRE